MAARHARGRLPGAGPRQRPLLASARARAGAGGRGRARVPRGRLPAQLRIPAHDRPAHRGIPVRRWRAAVGVPRRDVGGHGPLLAILLRQPARAELGAGRRWIWSSGSSRGGELGRRGMRLGCRGDPAGRGVPGVDVRRLRQLRGPARIWHARRPPTPGVSDRVRFELLDAADGLPESLRRDLDVRRRPRRRRSAGARRLPSAARSSPTGPT